jgi:hypothetical protein
VTKIKVMPSPTADTRTCDPSKVTRDQLLASSRKHIGDVREALYFFAGALRLAAERHDFDKITDIDSFHGDFVTGFSRTEWWDRHRKINRHHLEEADGVPADVNLVDVLEYVADCVMAGMARSGSVWPLEIDPGMLVVAFKNTVELLASQVELEGGDRP